MSRDQTEEEYPKSWWQTIPGLLTGLAGVVTAITGLIIAMHQVGILGNDDDISSAEKPHTLEDGRTTPTPDQPLVEDESDQVHVEDESEQFPIERTSSEIRAQINDPDGYTNIRSGPGTGHSIITRVIEGETFHTIPQTGDWWPVRTEDNMFGYIHRSRISLQD